MNFANYNKAAYINDIPTELFKISQDDMSMKKKAMAKGLENFHLYFNTNKMQYQRMLKLLNNCISLTFLYWSVTVIKTEWN